MLAGRALCVRALPATYAMRLFRVLCMCLCVCVCFSQRIARRRPVRLCHFANNVVRYDGATQFCAVHGIMQRQRQNGEMV